MRNAQKAAAKAGARDRFASKLRQAIDAAGYLKLTDFCRRVEDQIGVEFGRQTLNGYLQARNFPQLDRLYAMAKVLKIEPSELIPREEWGYMERLVMENDEQPFSMVAETKGVRLKLNVLLDIQTAMEIVRLATNVDKPRDGVVVA